jgi:PAS domain S-box-containing protein
MQPSQARPDLLHLVEGSDVDAGTGRSIGAGADFRVDEHGRLWVEIGPRLEAMCADLVVASHSAPRVDLIVTSHGEVHVELQDVAPITVFVREAVANALKYSHPTGVPGKIGVGCRRAGDGALEIEVRDDGVGLPEGCDAAVDGGLGFGLMRRSGVILGGSLSFSTSPLGLTVLLRAPRPSLLEPAHPEPSSFAARAGAEDRLKTRTGATPHIVPDTAPDATPDTAPGVATPTAGPARDDLRFRDLLEALPTAVYTTDAAGGISFFNQAAVVLWGREPELGELWCGSWRLHWPDGRPMAHGDCPMGVAINEKHAIKGAEAVAERPDGTRVPFMAYPTPLLDDAGNLLGAVNCLIDISDRKQAEERRNLLAREVHHRAKNLLAVVSAIVSRGIDGKRPAGETRTAVLGRLAALAKTYDNLITTAWEGMAFGQIVATQLAPFAGQIDIEGPPLVLTAEAAQSFTLVVHELATNAVKYGALSTPGGRVAVRWSIEGLDGSSRFAFSWRESGGPQVVAPDHRGFGSVVLERVIGRAFDTPPRVEFDPEGLRYSVSIALDAVSARD